jgi:hypothetical protein
VIHIAVVTMPSWVTAVVVASSAIAAVAAVVGQALNVVLIEKRLKAQSEARAEIEAQHHAELLKAVKAKGEES